MRRQALDTRFLRRLPTRNDSCSWIRPSGRTETLGGFDMNVVVRCMVAALALSACTSSSEDIGLTDDAEDIGSAAIALRVGDLHLQSASFTVTGPMFSTSGTIDVGSSDQLSATIAGLPA